MAEYQLSTVWRIKSPLQELWGVLYHPDTRPSWWKNLVQVIEMPEGWHIN